jgi:hypothetical protein
MIRWWYVVFYKWCFFFFLRGLKEIQEGGEIESDLLQDEKVMSDVKKDDLGIARKRISEESQPKS